MELAENRAISVAIVFRLDRLARSLAHACAIEALFQEEDVAIVSVSEAGIDTTTPVGRFLFGNLMNAAQLEKEIIRERAKMAKYAAALKGLWTESQVPFGYKRTRGNHLHIKKQEAETVVAVFRAYQERLSYSEAAFALNGRNLSFRGEPWTARRVRHILENEIYRGCYRMSGVERIMPRLEVVDPDLFEAVRSLRMEAVRKGVPLSEDVRQAAIESVFSQYLAGLSHLDAEN